MFVPPPILDARDSQSSGRLKAKFEAWRSSTTTLLKAFWRPSSLPCPLKAGLAHYQFATLHPYYEGNGRIARLLTTLILHQGGYALKGSYSLEEYYAHHLPAYYKALDVGPSHHYDLGRAAADITSWLTFFCDGMAQAFENVKRRAESFWIKCGYSSSVSSVSSGP